jgi:hypothetical protein
VSSSNVSESTWYEDDDGNRYYGAEATSLIVASVEAGGFPGLQVRTQPSPAPEPVVPATTRTRGIARPRVARLRPRGAGRPRARALSRASSRSGDSGDESGSSEGEGEPPARPLIWIVDSEFGRVNRALAALLRQVRR